MNKRSNKYKILGKKKLLLKHSMTKNRDYGY